MIYYMQDITEELRAMLRRIDRSDYFCYNNGRRVRGTSREIVRGSIADTLKLLENMRPPLRTQDKFEG